MTHIDLIQQYNSVPFVTLDLTDLKNSQSTFSLLWGYLKAAHYLGYRYYRTTGNTSPVQYGEGANNFDRTSLKPCVYDKLFHKYRDEGHLVSQLVSVEGIVGGFVVCPVYGPYNQNAVFILHSSPVLADDAEEGLRKIHMVLHNAHVAIAHYETIQREKELALSRREEQVLILMTEGMSNRSIAEQLNISVHTINGYVRRLMLKLNARDRVSACMIGLSIPKIANKTRRCLPR